MRAPGSGEMLIHLLLQHRGGAALMEALEPSGSPSLSLGSEPVREADAAWRTIEPAKATRLSLHLLQG